MEKVIEKRTSKVPFYIIAIITLLSCVGYFIGLGGYISIAAPTGIAFDQFLSVLYASGGMVVACTAALLVILLVLKNKREMWAKILIWGILILSVLASASFYGSLTQLSGATFDQALAFVARFVPYIALSVASVAMIAQWDSSEHKATNLISFVCMLVSAVMVIFYVKSIMDEIQNGLNITGTIDTVYLYQYAMMIALAIMLVLVTLVYFYATINRRKFDCTMIGMTDEEAEIVERIEQRVDEIADEVEELAAEGEAIVEAEKEMEAAIDEVVEASVDEAMQDSEEKQTEEEKPKDK